MYTTHNNAITQKIQTWLTEHMTRADSTRSTCPWMEWMRMSSMTHYPSRDYPQRCAYGTGEYWNYTQYGLENIVIQRIDGGILSSPAMAVSYTHLDVYKRQTVHNENPLP